jgi:hypothetical protein
VIEVRTFRKPRYIGKKSALAFSLVAAVGVGTAISTTPASASTDYSVDATQACHDTYNYAQIYAVWGNYNNTYSWECMVILWTPVIQGITVGAPNFQKYCSITYPGSQAVMVSSDSNGWRCRL